MSEKDKTVLITEDSGETLVAEKTADKLRTPTVKDAFSSGTLVLVASVMIAVLLSLYTFGLDKLVGLIVSLFAPAT